MNSHRLNYITLALYSVLYFGAIGNVTGDVLGLSSTDWELDNEISYPHVRFSSQIKTTTAFAQKEIEEESPIEYETEYVDDKELEYGKEEIKTPGKNGTKTDRYLLTYWVDEEIDRMLIGTQTEPPVTEVIAKGKKIVWKTLDTSDEGEIKYWAKLEVFATKYDHTCLGCNHTTAVGAYLQKGVCAVDPKVIKMYTKFYVPGYGMCQALDVGGLVKGNRIDLAYEDVKVAPWRTSYVTIYLMDNPPE